MKFNFGSIGIVVVSILFVCDVLQSGCGMSLNRGWGKPSEKDLRPGQIFHRYIFVYNINSKTSSHNVSCKFAIAYDQN